MIYIPINAGTWLQNCRFCLHLGKSSENNEQNSNFCGVNIISKNAYLNKHVRELAFSNAKTIEKYKAVFHFV